MKPTCVHSCKGLCNALEIAEFRERESIKEYEKYLEGCDYPEVRAILAELIEERANGLVRLQEKRQTLSAKFSAIDQITESFR